MKRKIAGAVVSIFLISVLASGSSQAAPPNPNWCQRLGGRSAHIIDVTLDPQTQKTYFVSGNTTGVSRMEITGPDIDIFSQAPTTVVTSGFVVRMLPGWTTVGVRGTTDPFWVVWDISNDDRQPVNGEVISDTETVTFVQRLQVCTVKGR